MHEIKDGEVGFMVNLIRFICYIRIEYAIKIQTSAISMKNKKAKKNVILT